MTRVQLFLLELLGNHFIEETLADGIFARANDNGFAFFIRRVTPKNGRSLTLAYRRDELVIYIMNDADHGKFFCFFTMALTIPLIAFVVFALLRRLLKIGSRDGSLPPGPPTLPLLGNLHQFPTEYTRIQWVI